MLAEVREHGIARAIDEPVAGIGALSAPVFDHTRNIVLAITAIGPSGSFDGAWNGDIAMALHACAQRVSKMLGFVSV
jgi:DNA-binding IclR family transcriptional regulator